MPTRCNRGFYCSSYCLLNMFPVPLCPSSGAREQYTVVAACGFSCCGFQVAGLVWSWGYVSGLQDAAACICCLPYVYLLYYVCIAVLTLDAGLLARSQYPEGPATGHLNTGFSWFPCVYKQMLRWFPSFQVATTCFSCSPPDFNFQSLFFYIFVYM